MRQEDSPESPQKPETKPSLLATMSLVLALVPYALMIQLTLAYSWHVPAWLRSILSYGQIVQGSVALISPLIGLVCACVALVKIRKDPLLRGKWKANTGIGLAVVFYLGGVLLPRLGDGGAKARAASCISNLKAISAAITMYADDHENQMPATLEGLVNGTYLPVGGNGLTRCPWSGKAYHYPGARRTWEASTTEISVYCDAGHLGQMIALYNDGRITPTTSATVKASVAAIRSEKK